MEKIELKEFYLYENRVSSNVIYFHIKNGVEHGDKKSIHFAELIVKNDYDIDLINLIASILSYQAFGDHDLAQGCYKELEKWL